MSALLRVATVTMSSSQFPVQYWLYSIGMHRMLEKPASTRARKRVGLGGCGQTREERGIVNTSTIYQRNDSLNGTKLKVSKWGAPRELEMRAQFQHQIRSVSAELTESNAVSIANLITMTGCVIGFVLLL